MKARIGWIIIGLVLMIGLGLSIYGWNQRPKLVNINPEPGSINIPITSSISMEFSESMQRESVVDRLKIEPAVEGIFSWQDHRLSFTPNKSWPVGQEITVQLWAGARASSWLALPMNQESWSFKTDETSLAYLWPNEGPADIYSLNPGTGEITEYTHGMGVLDFTISDHGENIYFSASNAHGGSDLYRIHRIQVDNLQSNDYPFEKLLDCGLAQCRSPAISGDERYLAYEYLVPNPAGGLGQSQIWLLNLPELNSTPFSDPAHETVQPSWSSNGWLAYYDHTGYAYELVNPRDQQRVQLPNQTGQPGTWSPDGKFYLAPELSYNQASNQTETATSHLLNYIIDTGLSEDLSLEKDVEDVEGMFSPDGRSIAFARKYLDAARWTLGRQIWIMDSDGSEAHAITDEPDYNHYDLTWSEDGKWLAYVRFNQAKLSDSPELWMIGSDGSSRKQLIIGGFSPLWIP